MFNVVKIRRLLIIGLPDGCSLDLGVDAAHDVGPIVDVAERKGRVGNSQNSTATL